MINNHTTILNTLNLGSEKVLKFSKLLIALQILIATPAIISIVLINLTAVILFTLSLLSVVLLCCYWWVKFMYLSKKFEINDMRREELLKIGFPQVSLSKENTVANIAGNKIQYDLKNRENCIYFLNKLLNFSVFNKFIYSKSEYFLIWILLISLVIVIILFGLIVAYAGTNIDVTIARVILSVVILVFSSDILTMIFKHHIVSDRLTGIIQRLLVIEGNDRVSLRFLTTSIIDEFGLYTDVMSNANEIFPNCYSRHREGFSKEIEKIQKGRDQE